MEWSDREWYAGNLEKQSLGQKPITRGDIKRAVLNFHKRGGIIEVLPPAGKSDMLEVKSKATLLDDILR